MYRIARVNTVLPRSSSSTVDASIPRKIIKRAHGAYTPITRMDESIYQAYTEYIQDKLENTIWDLDDIASTIDDDDLGSTVFTRAILIHAGKRKGRLKAA